MIVPMRMKSNIQHRIPSLLLTKGKVIKLGYIILTVCSRWQESRCSLWLHAACFKILHRLMYSEKEDHTITQVIRYSPYEDKHNIGTTFPPLSEVKSLCWVFWLHAASNYHTASGPYTAPPAHWAYLIVPIRMNSQNRTCHVTKHRTETSCTRWQCVHFWLHAAFNYQTVLGVHATWIPCNSTEYLW